MIRRSRWLAPLAASSLALLAGCSGNKSSTSTTSTYNLISAAAVLGQGGFTSAAANAGGAAGAGTLNQPLGGAAGSSGASFFLPDYGNNRVLGFNSAPTVNNTPANFVLGQADFTTTTPGTPVAQGNFAFPGAAWVGSALDANGNPVLKLVVADTSHNRVLIWNTVPTANTPPDVVIGQAGFTTSTASASPPTAADLSAPSAAAIANNQLFVVDQGNNRVLIWKTVPTANGVPADIVIGQPDFATNSAGITQAKMSAPQGIWTDGYRLFVADSSNNRVLYWTAVPTTSGANANFVIGQSSFTFSTTSPSAQTMNTPIGIASDGTRLFVADKGNNRVLVFNSFPLANNAAADAVLGQQNFTHTGANIDNGTSTNPQSDTPQVTNITARTLNGPTGVYYDSSAAKLYVTDRGNNRVMIYNGTSFPAPGN